MVYSKRRCSLRAFRTLMWKLSRSRCARITPRSSWLPERTRRFVRWPAPVAISPLSHSVLLLRLVSYLVLICFLSLPLVPVTGGARKVECAGCRASHGGRIKYKRSTQLHQQARAQRLAASQSGRKIRGSQGSGTPYRGRDAREDCVGAGQSHGETRRIRKEPTTDTPVKRGARAGTGARAGAGAVNLALVCRQSNTRNNAGNRCSDVQIFNGKCT